MPRTSALLIAVLLATSTCGGHATEAPADTHGSPLARDDPDRYLAPRADGLRVRRLAPPGEEANFGRADVYGLEGWCRDYRGALIGTTEDADEPPAGFLAVCRTTSPDTERGERLAFLAAGTGRVSATKDTRIAGQDVRTGRLTNNTGRYDFVTWAPTDGVAVTLTVTVGNRRGLDPEPAAADVIRWSRR